MRQIFTSLPYVLPADPPEIAALYRAQGTERSVKKGETLKRGGEDAKLFFITEGLAAYFVAEELTGRPKVLALLPPGRAAGDLTAAIENRCNVHTRMLTDGKVLVLPASILTEAMRSEGGFAEVLVRSVIAKEECHIEGMVANFTLPPEQRLKVFFQSALTHEGGCVEGETWWRIPYRLSAELLGEIVNLNRVSVAKILSGWFREGLAKREGTDLFVRPALFDRALLAGCAGIPPKRGLSYKCKVRAYRIAKKFAPRFAEKKFGSPEYRTLSPVMRESYKKIVNEEIAIAKDSGYTCLILN